MKFISLTAIIIILSSCSEKNSEEKIIHTSSDWRDITLNLSIQEFESVKTFILEHGDRQTYCNMYSNNPHYSFVGFETYLNPEIGQDNPNCDQKISDFNRIVIRARDSVPPYYEIYPQYYHILIVRKGDLKGKQVCNDFYCMKEEKVYLMKEDEYDPDLMVEGLSGYLDIMKNKI